MLNTISETIYILRREFDKTITLSGMYRRVQSMIAANGHQEIADALHHAIMFMDRYRWSMDMSKAPTDGTMLQLKVLFTEHNLEDRSQYEPVVTMGFNDKDHTGLDQWQFAGWCWQHDHFTEGKGIVISWREFPKE